MGHSAAAAELVCLLRVVQTIRRADQQLLVLLEVLEELQPILQQPQQLLHAPGVACATDQAVLCMRLIKRQLRMAGLQLAAAF